MGKLERKPSVTVRRDKDHVGFDSLGGSFRTGRPVENDATKFVKRLCIEAWSKKLSPAEVLETVRVQPAGLQRALGIEFMERWWWDKARYDEWQGLQTATSAQSTVKFYASGEHMWLRDPHQWGEICAEEARLRQQPRERPVDPDGAEYLRRIEMSEL